MTDSAIRFGIIGHKGRMGKAIAKAIEQAGHVLQVGVDEGGNPGPLASQCDVLVDFSAPTALKTNLDAAKVAGIPIVIGTTGLDDEHFQMIEEASQMLPLLQTGNTSLGVNLLCHIAHKVAETLDTSWDIEILEMHHRDKVDAPSGTARQLGTAVSEGRGIALGENSEVGRSGPDSKRAPGAIGFASLRGGTAAGDHSVIFAGNEERIVLSHSAEDRSIFARGAVKAAEWLIGKQPGLYSMNDVLGL
ncbi:4-hydroxy-tetrahydrodipicolinate reductase [Altererythrobacter sp. MF3-039]|uniref:4-hydroxy-tetrahydrodipicolinate reductase n=1 Tax=Altererythrobacter sp. MF3-039 TaxID=3252901 RepID=UPI00390C9136